MTVARGDKSALDWLRERRQRDGRPLISDIEYQAGDRIRKDFWRARMMARVTTNYDAATAGRDSRSSRNDVIDFRQSTLDARERVRQALGAVGADYAGLLIDLCCLDRKLTEVELEAGWPRRSGKVILQLALRQLARHYGLLRDPDVELPKPHQIRHWGDLNYRPQLSLIDDQDG